jgi:uncharacterized protein YukE
MPKMPWVKWYCQDWLSDPCLSLCSPATRGIWKDALAATILGNNSELRGTRFSLSRICRCTPEELDRAITELRDTSTADVEIEQNGNIILRCRRIHREFGISELRSIAGKISGTKRQQASASASVSASVSVSQEGNFKGGITTTVNPPPYPNAESKQPYGEFGHVKLSESEHTKLLQKHGEIKLTKGITLLDDYIEAKGKRYHNHYAVLKEGSWVWERIGQSTGRTSTASDAINRRRVYEDMQAELAELRSRRWDDDAKQRYPDKWARYHELKDKVAKLKREFEAAIT